MVFNHFLSQSREPMNSCLVCQCLEQGGVVGICVSNYPDQETGSLELFDFLTVVMALVEVGIYPSFLLGKEPPFRLSDGFNQ